MDLGLNKRSVFISGSSFGIGCAIAERFLEEGARVTLTGRDPNKLDAARIRFADLYSEDSIFTFAGDLTDPEIVLKAIDETCGHWGSLNHLITNIGSGKSSSGFNIGGTEWDRMFELNFRSAVQLIEAAIPKMQNTAAATITMIGSIAGLEALNAPIAYSTAKAAVAAYGVALAREVAHSGIRVNCVAPGNILFPGSTWDKKLADNRSETEAYIKSEVPLKRFGTPEEIADIVVFLSSRRASFITGACIVVDGGQTRRLN